MINVNNEFFQNSMINARKDNDDWSTAYDVVKEAEGESTPSPEPEKFIVTLEMDAETGDYYADKTLTEALEAYNNGANIVFKGAGDGDDPDIETVSVVPIYGDAEHPQTITSLAGNFGLFSNPNYENKLYMYGVYYASETELYALYMIEHIV